MDALEAAQDLLDVEPQHDRSSVGAGVGGGTVEEFVQEPLHLLGREQGVDLDGPPAG